MSDDTYTLLLRSDADHTRPADRAGLIGHLTRIPGAEADPGVADRFTFGEADAAGSMTLDFLVVRDGQRVSAPEVTDEEAARCDEVEIRMPRPWVMERGPQVFALVFMLAEWAKWEVFDPQIEDTLQKEAVLSGLVAMRQAQREHEAQGGAPTPGPVGSGGASFERPPRPGEAPPPPAEDYRPTQREAPKAPSKKKPWWKLGG